MFVWKLEFLKRYVFIFLLSLLGGTLTVEASQSIESRDANFKRYDKGAIQWIGAFRLPLKETGDSRIAYSEGTFALHENGKSFFVVGHAKHQAIAEMSIPKLVRSKKLADLKMAKIIQPFKSYLKTMQRKRKEKLDVITGMEYYKDQLWVNGVERYDANANEKFTSFIVRDASNLKSSKLSGLYSLKGAAHAAGWVSKIPEPWRKKLASEFLSGYASNVSINSRLSIGPTAFLFSPFTAFINEVNKGFMSTTPLLDYSLKHPLNADRYNDSGNNDVWTEVSEARYGFIVPGTDSYFVIGNSGGHKSGIGYKITQDNGRLCGGPCSKKASDNYNYYWVWDVNELYKSKNSGKLPWTHKPYEYGFFDTKRRSWKIIGADFDETTSRLYVLYAYQDYEQSKYEKAPLMYVYQM